MKNTGRWANRFKHDNPREVAFAEQWEFENERINSSGVTLSALLYGHGHGRESTCNQFCEADRRSALDPDGAPHDRIVAATLMQWLGSNVGFSFLRESLKRCGYEIRKADR